MWTRIKFAGAVGIGAVFGVALGVYEWWSQWVERGDD